MGRVAAIEANEVLFAETFERVQRYMHHPFLQASRVRQSVSRFHFDVAHWILRTAGVKEDELRAVLEAVLLLHQGLSIHEQVDEETAVKRQLVVLAGDYDSSQYYWLLARHGTDQLILALSEAVVRINEAKMTLYRSHRLPVHTYLSLLETIQGELLFALVDVYLPGDAERRKQVRSLVRALAVHEAIRRTGNVTFRQAREWLGETVESMRRSSDILSDDWNAALATLKQALGGQTVVEGNRSS